MRIGILEDDSAQQELYKLWFNSNEDGCQCYGTVQAFLAALATETFDLLLIDWNLPDGSGDVALKWVREHVGWDIPVIFVTARDSEIDVVTALRAGADDFVVKPPKFHELLARIGALTRRLRSAVVPRAADSDVAAAAPTLQYGAYEVDQERRSIAVDGKVVVLTQREFELACYLFQSPGKLLSRVHLLEKLWGVKHEIDTRTVDTHVSRIRRKLGIGPVRGWRIIPVYGWGYRMEEVALAESASAQP